MSSEHAPNIAKQELSKKDRGSLDAGDIIKLGAFGFAALLVYEVASDWRPELPNIPGVDKLVDAEVEPEEAVGGVDHESYEVEVEFDLTCKQIVSAAVDVKSEKEGWELVGINIGDGKVDKKIFGDFLLCGDDTDVSRADETVNPVTNKVTELKVTLDGLQVFHPRVDHLDPRNCVGAQSGDSMERVNELLAEYNQKVADGEQPNCDDGFKVTRLGGPDSLAEAIDISYKAAQLALTVDANPREIIAAADAEYAEDIRQQLQAQARYQDASVIVNVDRPSDTETVQTRLDAISEDLSAVFREVRAGTDEEGNYLYVEDAEGANATVRFGGYAALAVDELEIAPAGDP